MNLLFVCTANRHRSKTAEHLFAGHPEHTAKSAGLASVATRVLEAEHVLEADKIYCFEKWQYRKIKHRFKRQLEGKTLICLYIEDDYDYGEGALVHALRSRLGGTLGDWKGGAHGGAA